MKIALNVDAQALSWNSSPNGEYYCNIEIVSADLSNKEERLDYQVRFLGGSVPAEKFAGSRLRT